MYDIAIIGSGPGGTGAAIRAAKLGASVVVFEERELGGVCLNRGCIPTKTIAHTAEVISELRKADELGITLSTPAAQGPEINFQAVQRRKDSVVERLRKGLEGQIRAKGIDIIYKHSTLRDAFEAAPRVIVATGAHPVELTALKFDGARILSSDDILTLKELPKSALLIGGGVIGCEWASIFRAFGMKVAIAELLDRLLPQEARDLGKALELSFKKRGIEVLLQTDVKKRPDFLNSFEKLFVAVGRKPDLEGMDLEGLDASKVVFIGDCAGRHQLAHAAAWEGERAAEHLLGSRVCGSAGRGSASLRVCESAGHGSRANIEEIFNTPPAIPSCIFTIPEIASVGRYEGRAVKVPYTAIGRAHTTGQTEGFVRLVVEDGPDKSKSAVIGAQIFGARATDIIHEVALAIGFRATARDIAQMIHAHPTFSEAIAEAARALC